MQKTSFFISPITSTKFHIYESDGKTKDELCECDMKSIAAKMMCVPYNDCKFVYMPILHTLEYLNK